MYRALRRIRIADAAISNYDVDLSERTNVSQGEQR
jgi:hypothetical protein